MKTCSICAQEYAEDKAPTVFTEAGEWFAGEVWQDAGAICPQCLENRARLAMMYCHNYNT